MLDGEVVEDPEDDLETGTKTWCGWCSQTEEQQAEHVVADVDLPDDLNGVADRKGNDPDEVAEMSNVVFFIL